MPGIVKVSDALQKSPRPMRYVAFDGYVTGPSSYYDQLLGFSLVVFDGGEPTGEVFTRSLLPPRGSRVSINVREFFDADIDPTAPELREALANRAASLILDEAIPTRRAMGEFAQWSYEHDVYGLPVVTDRLALDLPFYEAKLANETAVYTGLPLGPNWYCLQQYARRLFPDIPQGASFSNQTLALLLQEKHEFPHPTDTMGHALITGRLYWSVRTQLSSLREAQP